MPSNKSLNDAAPEMLIALERLLMAIASLSEIPETVDVILINYAKNAVAKAKGF